MVTTLVTLKVKLQAILQVTKQAKVQASMKDTKKATNKVWKASKTKMPIKQGTTLVMTKGIKKVTKKEATTLT